MEKISPSAKVEIELSEETIDRYRGYLVSKALCGKDATGVATLFLGHIYHVEAENKRLRSLVEKLPKTGDGVTIELGMRVWWPELADDAAVATVLSVGRLAYDIDAGAVILDEPEIAAAFYTDGERTICRVCPHQCYSTREAAEKARL